VTVNDVSAAERRVVLCRRLLDIGPNPSTKDAELIAFRVGEYHPRRVTLPDIGPPSTEGKETFDFCGLIDRTEVRMESVLACFSPGTGTNNRPGTRFGVGLISNSSAVSPTTTQPKASAHHRSTATGS
jgi:hypothetical protein